MTASGKEVKIVDKTKTVGTTSITIDGVSKSSTVDGVTHQYRLGERDGGQGNYHTRYEGCPRTATNFRWGCS